MKRLVLLVVCGLFGVGVAGAQTPTLPAQCKAWLPKAMDETILMEQEIKRVMALPDFGMSERATNKYWVVCSDRVDNPTYVAPQSGAAQYMTLGFNQMLTIAEVRNGYALVYSDPIQENYPLISHEAECYGWVPMSRLLLWRSCLSDEHGITQKALLCVNLDKSSSDSDDLGSGSFDPYGRTKFALKSDMNFYYVMKRENKMTLLALQSQFEGATSGQVLFCWVPDNLFVPWNQRSCLEPTWEKNDVEYFYARGIKIPIFKNKQMDKGGDPISRIEFHKKNEKGRKSLYMYRMNGSALRFPVLDGSGDTYYSMSTFSTIGGAAEGTGAEDASVKADSIKTEKLEQMLHINLAIVVDGTSSMQPFYPAIKEAIKDGCMYFNKENMRIKVGVVIYRDYTDGDAGLVEVLPMTDVKNVSRINDFLDSGGNYSIKSAANDYTQTEALYYGVNTALDQLRFKDGESNMMIIIGDCGNAADDKQAPSDKAIISKLVNKDIHLSGFQVQNKNSAAYMAFNNQVLNLIRTSMTQKYKKLASEYRVEGKRIFNENKRQEGFDFGGKVDKNIYLGQYRSADVEVNNGVMEPSKLAAQMTSSIGEFSKIIQTQIDMVTKAGSQGEDQKNLIGGAANVKGDVLTVEDNFLLERLGPEWAELMRKKNALVNFNGYANKKDASGRDFFKPVVFISREEYLVLMQRLAPVYQAAMEQSRDRTPYIEAMKALVRALAPGITDAEMSKLSNSEITRMIGGLNEATESLHKYTLDQLSSQQAVSNEEFDTIKNDFVMKYRALEKVGQRAYEFKKTFNNAIYYWIPMENLP